MKKIYLILLICFSGELHAQFDMEWIEQFKAQALTSELASDVMIDNSGNILIAGKFHADSIEFFNQTLYKQNSSFSYQSFIAKIDANGNLIWSQSPSGEMEVIQIDQLSNGDYLLTSTFDSDINFNSGVVLNSPSNLNFGFVKCTQAGVIYEAKSYGGGGTDYISGVVVDANDDIYVTGKISPASNILIGSIPVTIQSTIADLFIGKFGSNLNPIWFKNDGNFCTLVPSKMVLDSAHNLFITGSFYNSSFTFQGYTMNNSGGNDWYLIKSDSTGTCLMAKSFGNSSNEYCSNLNITPQGNLLLSGVSNSDPFVIAGNTFPNAGGLDIILAESDLNGNAIFSKGYSSSQEEWMNAEWSDNERLYYAFRNKFDLQLDGIQIDNQGLAHSGFYYADASYNAVNGFDIYGPQAVQINHFAISSDEQSIYLFGSFVQTSYFGDQGDSLISVGYTDLFFIKLSQCALVKSVSVGNFLHADQDNANYQWMDCSTSPYTNITNEIGQNYQPPQSGFYAVEISNGNCVDTSECIYYSPTDIINIDKDQLAIYPNPTSSHFQINSNQITSGQIKIFNLNGQLVKQFQFSHQTKFDVSDLPQGLYSIQLISDNRVYSSKLMKLDE